MCEKATQEDLIRAEEARRIALKFMPWTLDNWRQELVKFLERCCTGMDDHDNGHLAAKGVSLLERCGKCREMYSELEPSIQAIIHDARATGRMEVENARKPKR